MLSQVVLQQNTSLSFSRVAFKRTIIGSIKSISIPVLDLQWHIWIWGRCENLNSIDISPITDNKCKNYTTAEFEGQWDAKSV